jgi:hypothetical protein
MTARTRKIERLAKNSQSSKIDWILTSLAAHALIKAMY